MDDEVGVEEQVRNIAVALVPEGHLLTGYVIVVEHMDGDNNKYLECDWMEGMPYWTRDGMLDHAKDITEED